MSSSSLSSSSTCFSTENLLHQPFSTTPSEKLCYVNCSLCDTVLAVSVPCTSLFRTVAVRCGHCSNLFSVNMRSLLLPAANLSQTFFSAHTILEELRNNASVNQLIQQTIPSDTRNRFRGFDEMSKPPVVNRPPEKRQRVPSAYNRFIKDEIQRIKASNPEISHREAFSSAAKNWAHFPHIHFGLMPEQPMKRPNLYQQEEALLAPTANVGVSPY